MNLATDDPPSFRKHSRPERRARGVLRAGGVSPPSSPTTSGGLHPPLGVPNLRPALVALLFALVMLAGCGKSGTGGPKEDTKAKEQRPDPWEVAAKKLRKDTDPTSVKTTLGQLKSDLAGRDDVPRPPALTPETEKALADLVPLAASDLAELRAPTFTSLDPVYVADCFYLRDAARSLDQPGSPPQKLAQLGFAWVCRQVYLNPWLIEVEPGVAVGTALPPTAVLRRGYGSGLERAYVFLALLQQLGIDGCLIGPPDAATKPSVLVVNGPDGKPLTGAPKGPFWAVGARVAGDVLLFDPWRGQQLPGTLAQLKANPDPLKPWFEDKANVWGVTPDDVKKATAFLAVPVSSLSPRMAKLDEKLTAEKPTDRVRLAIDPAALRTAFADQAKVPEVKFWNPADDRFAYGRATATFLPLDEGGLDRGELSDRLHTLYNRALLPRSVLSLPIDMLRQPLALDRLAQASAGSYFAAFFAAPAPRERIQRGQFQDATRNLTDKQDAYQKGLTRLRSDPTAQAARDWCQKAEELYAELGRVRLDNDPVSVANAQQAIELFWKQQGGAAQLILDRAGARVGLAEATFLLALTKHEEAERQQARAELKTGADADRAKTDAVRAWKEAANAWQSYLEMAPDQGGFPGRLPHARGLAARADELAAAK